MVKKWSWVFFGPPKTHAPKIVKKWSWAFFGPPKAHAQKVVKKLWRETKPRLENWRRGPGPLARARVPGPWPGPGAPALGLGPCANLQVWAWSPATIFHYFLGMCFWGSKKCPRPFFHHFWGHVFLGVQKMPETIFSPFFEYVFWEGPKPFFQYFVCVMYLGDPPNINRTAQALGKS